MALTPNYTVIGASHNDHYIQLQGPARMHRTNMATSEVGPGGVAANIARHLAYAIAQDRSTRGQRPHFIGVCGHAQHHEAMAAFARWQIRPHLIAMAGETPSYTAIIDADGDLVIGAANMALYDQVSIDDVCAHLPRAGVVVLDANFPEPVLQAIAATLPVAVSLFAAGTSVDKVARLSPLLARLDGIVLNRAEAEVLVGAAALSEMAQSIASRIRSRGFVLISDADQDAVLAMGDIVVSATPPPIVPKNVNGAGDAMAARLFHLFGSGEISRPMTEGGLTHAVATAVAAGAEYAAGETSD